MTKGARGGDSSSRKKISLSTTQHTKLLTNPTTRNKLQTSAKTSHAAPFTLCCNTKGMRCGLSRIFQSQMHRKKTTFHFHHMANLASKQQSDLMCADNTHFGLQYGNTETLKSARCLSVLNQHWSTGKNNHSKGATTTQRFINVYTTQ